jgi:hypothetical protein
MKLYQPVLFVVLGGTGCDVGADLERTMRDEICGPDGNGFRRQLPNAELLPYQLPSCIQFVYADMNQAELNRLPTRAVPGSEQVPVAAMTAHYVRDLVPSVGSYPELARNLRLEAGRETASWLPPVARDEPKITPLHRGAGQFPTVGRAALFGALMHDQAPVVRDLRLAIGNLSNSGEHLHALGGQQPRAVDVFVVFSVAGGTGSGIFYDYLHLIAHELEVFSQLKAKIYPLVLMPSAFEDGLGGGRAAQLNAALALRDLFRLVDQQNAGDAGRHLSSLPSGHVIDAEESAVQYPVSGRIVMRPGTTQTGYLFSRPAGATREDMQRSVVSLVMSLTGIQVRDADQGSGIMHQSFADSFTNEAARRQARAENGIGGRGVSTVLTASLTVPVDDLADIVSARILREAIEQLTTPVGKFETNRPDMEEFLIKAGVHQVLQRPASVFAEPQRASGAREVAAALRDRQEAMRAGIQSLEAQLSRDVPQLAANFDPLVAMLTLLGRMDVFRAQRVVFGHPYLRDEADRTGVAGLLHRRRGAPGGIAPPPTAEFRDKLFRKMQWTDEEPVERRAQQDAWYAWATHAEWANSWDASASQWRRPLERVERDLTALTNALTAFARSDHEGFERRSADLYRRRVSVSFWVPDRTGQMEQFYWEVYRRLVEQRFREGRLAPNTTQREVLATLVGPDAWRETYRISTGQTPEHAVSYLREQVKTQIKTFLCQPPPGEAPMLPRLADLLAEAAGRGSDAIAQDYLDSFRGKLAGLLPANFTPPGAGPLKVLVSYPASAPDPMIEAHLKKSVNLPRGPLITYDYSNVHQESISVLLLRSGMGVTEVDEVRDALRLWAGALSRPAPTDLLRWRQRTGYDFGYLTTREQDRVAILHRLLCALWNGHGSAHGPISSPDRLSIELGGGVVMSLPLSPLGQASSWGSLLRAYELWALDDDNIHRRFCAQLMQELPEGLSDTPAPPHALYLIIRDLAEGQITLLNDRIKDQATKQRTWATQMRGFWAVTLPAALEEKFSGLEAPVATNLRDLETITAGNPGN